MKNKLILFIVFTLISFNSYAESPRKRFDIIRCDVAPKIDGFLVDSVWEQSSFTKDFIQHSPNNGARPSENTLVKLLYDDNALYVGAYLYDDVPDSIFKELGVRDSGDEASADLFSIEINPFNDGRSSIEFMVSASGVQMDSQNTIDNMNKSWDAVWESEVKITDEGWIVEMKIPFSAIRFPQKEKPVWELNFFRLIKRKNEAITWNFVDKNIYGWLNQAGELYGIDGVKPDVRLSLMPYLSGYMSKFSNNNTTDWVLKGGLDLSYGINESFSLDMMLIPDFGQVQSDDKELNLSPYEPYYQENRAFFNEGTEIFNKGDIFYSRRLGGEPMYKDSVYNSLKENEIVLSNPTETKLLNATKISGRTKKGLGVGFLNAITKKSYASIRDTLENKRIKYLTQGVTNYNMIVLDQSFGKQSYLSLSNTFVLSPKIDYSSVVTASEFKYSNKKELLALSGNFAISQNKDNDKTTGYRYNINFAKVKGKFQFNILHSVSDSRFNPNALGYLERNNDEINSLTLNYNIFKSKGYLNELTNEFNINNSNLYKPYQFSKLEIRWQTKAVFRNFSYVIGECSLAPIPKYDYYEPRVTGWKFKEPTDFWFRFTYNTDNRKRLISYIRLAYWKGNEYDKSAYWLEFYPKWKINDHLSLNYEFYYQVLKNAQGFIDTSSDNSSVYFVGRDMNTYTNTLEGKFQLNRKSNFNLRVRHYWQAVKNKNFYLLEQEGTLNSNTDYTNYNHISYNVFNVDMVYKWEFSPGSEMTIVWKNNILTSDNNINLSYTDNLKNLLSNDHNNSISLSLKYYLDYAKIKR